MYVNPLSFSHTAALNDYNGSTCDGGHQRINYHFCQYLIRSGWFEVHNQLYSNFATSISAESLNLFNP